jgi:hypothetical protein
VRSKIRGTVDRARQRTATTDWKCEGSSSRRDIAISMSPGFPEPSDVCHRPVCEIELRMAPYARPVHECPGPKYLDLACTLPRNPSGPSVVRARPLVPRRSRDAALCPREIRRLRQRDAIKGFRATDCNLRHEIETPVRTMTGFGSGWSMRTRASPRPAEKRGVRAMRIGTPRVR